MATSPLDFCLKSLKHDDDPFYLVTTLLIFAGKFGTHISTDDCPVSVSDRIPDTISDSITDSVSVSNTDSDTDSDSDSVSDSVSDTYSDSVSDSVSDNYADSVSDSDSDSVSNRRRRFHVKLDTIEYM
jgi:hypothetical protein